MKQTQHWLTMLIIVMAVGFGSYAVAQMNGGGHDHSSMGSDPASHSKMADGGMMANMNGTMSEMMNRCQMMNDDFDQLQKHFEKMMQMDDMGELKGEMQNHHAMMLSMHNNMSEHRSKCQSMMTMMRSCGMGGMMQGNKADSNAAEPHSHNH